MNKSIKHILIISVLFLLIVGVVSTASAHGYNWTPTEFLDNISNIHNGDIITISNGTANVTKSYTINQSNIVIQAGTGATVTFQGSTTLSDSFLTITGTNVKLEGINFKNFKSNNYKNSGVININSGSATINNCKFTNNTAPYGGAINIDASSATISNCVLTNNTAHYGGAMHISSGSVTINNCKLINNTAQYGGAIRVEPSGSTSIKIIKSTFTQNQASSDGGAIYINMVSDATITDTTLTQNNAPNGGAIYIYCGCNVKITNSILTQNNATEGGAIYISEGESSATIFNSILTQNNATNGGAICIKWDSNATITDTTLTNNTAQYGGAICNIGGHATITNPTIHNNTNYDIYNIGFLTLNGGNGGIIYNTGIITNTLTAIILGNKTVNVAKNEKINLTACIKTGNYIVIGGFFYFVINGTEIVADSTGDHFTVQYNVTGEIGDEILVNGNYIPPSSPINYQTGILLIKKGVNLIEDDVAGNHATMIDYIDNENCENSVNYTIEKSIPYSLNASDIVKYYKNGTHYTVKLTDSHGSPVVNQTILMTLNSAKWTKPAYYNITTNASGIATLTINLIAGKYNIIANFSNATPEINDITVLEVNFVLTADNVVKYFKNSTNYTVTVTSQFGYIIPNESIKVKIYSEKWSKPVVYTIKTNSSGVAKLNINLISGIYTITATAGKTDKCNNIVVLPTLTAESITKTIKQSGSLQAKLVDDQGNLLADKEIKFTVKTKTYTFTTDSEGIATLPIHLGVGTWSFMIANPDTGAKTTATVKVTR